MEEQPDPVVWVLLGVPLLGLLALVLLRWVPAGHVLVVTRRGRVARVVSPGLRVRAPTSVLVPTGLDVALMARGTTREGIHVRLCVEAEAELVPPTPTHRYVDPVGAAVPAAERVLAAALAHADLDEVAGVLRETWDELTVAVDRETTPRGLRVRAMELVELDAVLADGPR